MSIPYYFKNKEGSLSKLLDEDGNVEFINDYIIELTEEHDTPVFAVITGGKV